MNPPSDTPPDQPRGPVLSDVSFESLGLSRTMTAVLKRRGYTAPTPIQKDVIPLALEGHDIVGQAKTGSGKTASFAIPILEMLERSADLPQALILAPTRELVQQIVVETEKLAIGQNVKIRGLYGGEPIVRQLRSLERGVDVVVGTPGRVMDLLERRALDFSDVYHVVLDEADRMLDIGFRDDIERILRRVPEPHQTMLLSATLSEEILFLSRKYMHHPIELNLSQDELSVESIKQYYITVDHDRKIELLMHLLEKEQPRQCIIFTRTKRGAEKLGQRISRKLSGVGLMHGDMAQPARNRVMQGFREGKVKILVATDVVGRGIDVEGISHVFNYDIPEDPENYVHRIGRTGRMGRDGVTFLFVCPDEGDPLTNIEMLTGKPIESYKPEGFQAYQKRSPDNREYQEVYRIGF
ncbi:DEAD/DEAH box helicase [bacterium]|nr:DEAD/DEAH box helicase [bacterium]